MTCPMSMFTVWSPKNGSGKARETDNENSREDSEVEGLHVASILLRRELRAGA